MSDERRQCCCSRGRDGGCGNQNKSQCGKTGGCSGGCGNRTIYITEEEKPFLLMLAQIPFLPLARFVMRSSKDDQMTFVALEPVFLADKNDSTDTVKKNGEILRTLEDKYLISLDYDMPLKNSDYSMYEESELYQSFKKTVLEGVEKEGFLYDVPELQHGSFALTSLGQDALDNLE